jgi:histidyl-tRNA synthetase
VDAETIEMLLHFLEPWPLETRLLVNSVGCPACRPGYVTVLAEHLERITDRLCEDCRRRSRANSLRVLDCKVESCQPYIEKLPAILDHLCEGCRAHFRRFTGHLKSAGIDFQVVPRLVRGLDYYVRTAFELTGGGLGAQNALAGGGRYDGLSELLGGPQAHGFGFALGLDRLVMLLEGRVKSEAPAPTELFLAVLGEPAFEKARSIMAVLRRAGIRCYVEFDGGSLKSQMRRAGSRGCAYVLILGEEELAQDRYRIRRMADSHQWEATLDDLVEQLVHASAARTS